MAKKKPPIDPLDGPKMALAGDIVAMDDALNVTRNRRLYVAKGAAILAIRCQPTRRPSVLRMYQCSIRAAQSFPGLIELHNHLAYNALRLP
jgi:5-methylthioadenosine/S-adenosylhomocysteine deaminase